MLKKNNNKICCSICKNLENGLYDIIIEKDYKLYNLEKYDICNLSSSLLKNVQEDVWESILYHD